MLDLFGRGEPADAITVADELGKRGDLTRVGGQAYLHQLIQAVPTAANAGYYAEIVHERAVLRRLVEAGTRIVQMGYAQGEGDIDDIVNRAQAEVYSVAEKRGGEDYHLLGELLNETMEEIEAASGRSDEMIGVPTGFLELDELTHGLHPGQMIVIAARPAVGKSTLGIDIARAAAINLVVTRKTRSPRPIRNRSKDPDTCRQSSIAQTRSAPRPRAQTSSAANPFAPTWTVCSPTSSPVVAETAAIVCERLWVSAPSTIIDPSTSTSD